MADKEPRPHPHIYLRNNGDRRGYTAHQAGGNNGEGPPQRNRDHHAQALTLALTEAVQQGEAALANRQAALEGGTKGFYIEFSLPEAQADIVDKLEYRRGKLPIELVNVQAPADGLVKATVFVPEQQKDYYLKKVASYRDEDNTRQRLKEDGTFETVSTPKNERLIASIETARLAVARSFYTDQPNLFPLPGETVWWEAWLRVATRATFERAAQAMELTTREHSLTFAEREVIVVQATAEKLGSLIANTDCVAELRLARDTPALFMGMDGAEQRAWVHDLADRLVPCGNDAPAVCLLDSGSTIGHPLIAPFLAVDDMHAFHGGALVGDTSLLPHGGHGTRMSGTALYGDLMEVLDGNGPVEVNHRLESVKILPDHGANDPDLYGAITADSISRAEIAAPHRPRAICLAITSPGDHWRGRPSSWSAELDALTFGRDEVSRFIAVSAGNIREAIISADYPAANDTTPIESPAQAWNVLTVGAFTERTVISDIAFQGWAALSPAGDIHPRSRTSVTWNRDWPLKPDVVFEGGNLAVDPGTGQSDDIDDLSLLTTFHRFNERAFSTTGDTSAATALAARMAAQILTVKPALWPETVRGLIVHSAEWTPAMRANQGEIGKANLVRRYGFGVPSIVRALGSLDNDVTIVAEDKLTPFKLVGSSGATDELAIHQLPWPKAKLLELDSAMVQLRITLSYFVEPNPGERGVSRRHTYASHGLRFELKHADDSLEVFLRRRNAQAGVRPARRAAGDAGWTIGPQLRNRGSLHVDIWEGTANELADRDAIIVYPVGGWWRENVAKGHLGEEVRYSLIASIRAAPGVELYTEIAAPIIVGI
ncbi:S8 family peptidase [Sphingomonas koreensis]|uniref:S8 family peptidase n=1 Tax=Sphingomonas koreensis TaxID=93064 RepID=UPI00234FAE3E|nr:S8 family peptidase [Sphingomonas koreensis]MDC7810120.1 S8 family peptidase [Sphingomonas koreensis]